MKTFSLKYSFVIQMILLLIVLPVNAQIACEDLNTNCESEFDDGSCPVGKVHLPSPTSSHCCCPLENVQAVASIIFLQTVCAANGGCRINIPPCNATEDKIKFTGPIPVNCCCKKPIWNTPPIPPSGPPSF